MASLSQERMDIDGKPATLVEAEHVKRYGWAEPQVGGNILDVACGTGFGSVMLARHGNVTGLDKDAGAIEIARRRAPAADFRDCLLPHIPCADDAFDAVVTFETIEHIDDDTGFVAEIRRVLKPGGLLLLSTPNAAVSSPGGPPSNPWHVREYSLDELRALLAAFVDVEVFMQGPVRTDAVSRTARRIAARYPRLRRPRRLWDWLSYGSGDVEVWDGRPAWYWVVRGRAPMT